MNRFIALVFSAAALTVSVEPGPARAERLKHGRALPDGPFDRAQSTSFAGVLTPENLTVAVEGGQRFVNPKVRREQ